MKVSFPFIYYELPSNLLNSLSIERFNLAENSGGIENAPEDHCRSDQTFKKWGLTEAPK
jgi:hypothetical protein